MVIWAARLPEGAAATLAPLRLESDLECLHDGAHLWVRGTRLDAKRTGHLRGVPELHLYDVDGDGLLRWPDSLAVRGTLPRGDWRPLAERMPLARLQVRAGSPPGNRLALDLVRAGGEQPARVLRTGSRRWFEYATRAPRVRLRPLRFAASQGDEVFIAGDPLPSLPGRRYWLTAGVAAPIGLRFAPLDAPELIAEMIALGEDELAIFDTAQQYVRLGADHLVAATRSAVRKTFRWKFDDDPATV